jgi:hypothetical protein
MDSAFRLLPQYWVERQHFTLEQAVRKLTTIPLTSGSRSRSVRQGYAPIST